jgi:hypothetical protein
MATNNNSPVFSFFKAPVSNIKPHNETTLRKIYNAIKGDYYKERTEKLRAILSLLSSPLGEGSGVRTSFLPSLVGRGRGSGLRRQENSKPPTSITAPFQAFSPPATTRHW